MLRILPLIALSAVLATAQGKTETGDLNGAAFRIDLPDKWNGKLVLYCHGYSPFPGKFENKAPGDVENVFLSRGFAVAQSGYATGGWAVEQGESDTLALARYFARKYGAPSQTYVTGHSMGGFLTTLLIERYGANFAGGLPLCGPLQPALQLFRNVWNDLVVFQYFLPGALPDPRHIPAEYAPTPAFTTEVTRKLDANPHALAALLRYSGLKSSADLAGQVTFWTYLMQEIYARAGGNPVDNRSFIYADTGDDNALNAAVLRVASDPQAEAYVRAFFTLNGKLERPILAIHTTYDTLVRPSIPSSYGERATETGSGDRFVQQFVPHDGHCNIQPAEIGAGFDELRGWVDSGSKPAGGAVPTQ